MGTSGVHQEGTAKSDNTGICNGTSSHINTIEHYLECVSALASYKGDILFAHKVQIQFL